MNGDGLRVCGEVTRQLVVADTRQPNYDVSSALIRGDELAKSLTICMDGSLVGGGQPRVVDEAGR